VVTVVALVALAFALRHQLAQTFSNLSKVQLWAVLLIIPIEFIDYHAQAKLYQSLFKTLGEKLSYKSLLRTSAELNFVNHVFPSGGVSGVSYFSLRLRGDNVRASKSTVVQMMKFVLIFLSFELLLLIGIVSLAVMGRASNFTVFIATMLATSLIVGTFIFGYIVESKRRINVMLTALTRAVNKLLHILHLSHAETINLKRAAYVFDELHDNYMIFRTKLRELKAPFWYAFLANLMEVLAIYVVYVAFGHWVNFGAVVLGYAVANFAGLISITPGGVGVYEALMTAVTISAGVPARLVLPVTIMYRVVSTLVQVPIGFVLYHQTISKQDGAKPSAN
jgi:uncharacterized protein (TIRG00374 family)